MPIVFFFTINSLLDNRQLSNSTRSLDTSYQRLASGLRINSAKDDAAGLQISDRMTSQINGLNQGNRNAQDGISYAQTAEGAMDEMTNMYQRIRTLALQSANGTNSAEDRQALQQEVTQLCAEIDRISTDTTFGGEKILAGTKDQISFQVGADASQQISMNADTKLNVTANVAKADATAKTGADAYDLDSCTEVATDKATDDDGNTKAGYTKIDTKYYANTDLEAHINEGCVKGENANGVVGIYAEEDVESKQVSKTITGWSVDSIATAFGLTATSDGMTANANLSNKGDASVSFDISTAENAQAVIANIDKFISAVDSKRAEFGAVENRLESTIRNQSNIVQNLSDARSQIRDTDFATETASMTQTNIIQQASQSILSQANQRPQLALSLMG